MCRYLHPISHDLGHCILHITHHRPQLHLSKIRLFMSIFLERRTHEESTQTWRSHAYTSSFWEVITERGRTQARIANTLLSTIMQTVAADIVDDRPREISWNWESLYPSTIGFTDAVQLSVHPSTGYSDGSVQGVFSECVCPSHRATLSNERSGSIPRPTITRIDSARSPKCSRPCVVKYHGTRKPPGQQFS